MAARRAILAAIVASAVVGHEIGQACPSGAQQGSVCTSSLLQSSSLRLKEKVVLREEALSVPERTSWVAGPWGDCFQNCSSMQFRTVGCFSFTTGKPAAATACKGPKPSATRKCLCGGLLGCAVPESGKCPSADEDKGSSSDSDKGIDMGSFEDLGCFNFEEPKDAATSRDKYDKFCKDFKGSGACFAGLSFYTLADDKMEPAMCFKFCTSKAMDVFGIFKGGVCRCGASVLNKVVWHMKLPRTGVPFDGAGLTKYGTLKSGEECPLQVFRYTGSFEADAVPRPMWEFKEQDIEYIDTIAQGREMRPGDEEDKPPGKPEADHDPDTKDPEKDPDPNIDPRVPGELPEGLPPGGAIRESLSQEDGEVDKSAALSEQEGETTWGRRRRRRRRRRSAGFTRNCWPSQCGPGRGPWRIRTALAPPGADDVWQEYVLVPYIWTTVGGRTMDDTRKDAFRSAAEAWRDVTCINLIEMTGRRRRTSFLQKGNFTEEEEDSQQEFPEVVKRAQSASSMAETAEHAEVEEEEEEAEEEGKEEAEEEQKEETEEKEKEKEEKKETEEREEEEEEDDEKASKEKEGAKKQEEEEEEDADNEEVEGAKELKDEWEQEKEAEDKAALEQEGDGQQWGRRRRRRRRRGIYVGIYESDSSGCYVSGMGEGHTDLNLGWCNSMLHVGNMIHEIGHAIGMNHEQKRPDAGSSYHGHGPYLTLYWNNIPSRWKPQYKKADTSYTGSANDGSGDPHSSGYAGYDFGSIMHYGGGNRYDTIPPESERLVGQRTALSAADIEQANDMYQCKQKAHRRRRTPPRRRAPRRRQTPPRRRRQTSPRRRGGGFTRLPTVFPTHDPGSVIPTHAPTTDPRTIQQPAISGP